MTANDQRDLAERVLTAALAATGFLEADEGAALTRLARRAAASELGPLLEIGAYCGRSTLFLAAGLAAQRVPSSSFGAERSPTRPPGVLYSLDHHHGSEEMQAGWPHHDPSLIDESSGRMDSLLRWRRAVEEAGAEELVVGLIGASATIAANWSTRLSLVFIDGGHSEANARGDYEGWAPKVAPRGLLVFHDVFPDPADGGRPPYECYLAALGSGRFVELSAMAVGSLRVLEAVGE